jgi:hypothetical protein
VPAALLRLSPHFGFWFNCKDSAAVIQELPGQDSRTGADISDPGFFIHTGRL